MKQRPMFVRAFPLDEITRAKSGDGRTVTAYAAMFDAAYEVRDVHGHYYESIARTAFDRTIERGALKNSVCLYNHGMTIHQTPSERYSQPLGTPLEIRPDARGLLTVTRYAKTPLADEILELIDAQAIRSQSFRGAIYRSSNPRPYAQSGLPLIERHELGLKDYGPAPFAVNADAEIVGIRSVAELQEEIAEMDEEERRQLLEALNAVSALPADSEPEATPQPEPAPQSENAPEVVAPADGPALSEYELRAAKLRHGA